MEPKRRDTKNELTSSDSISPVGIDVLANKSMADEHINFLHTAGLNQGVETEAWSVRGTNSQINYSTHGIYRYFGKFPAPIATKLIQEYTSPGDVVVDPACGSGTTGVEALLANRNALLFDINPLATLIAKVKTTPLPEKDLLKSISGVEERFQRSRRAETSFPEIDIDHWFLPQTVRQLSRIRASIEREENDQLRDFLMLSFASIIRRVSKATTQQGRLFLDVETAVEDVWPFFERAALRAADRINCLPRGGNVQVECRSVLDNSDQFQSSAPLVIYHPPYFNAYKYSSVNSLEMAWLEQSRKETRKGEIREFFKVGKPENADVYIEDVVLSLEVIRKYLRKGGVVAMMIGDARLKGEHVCVTAPIISKVSRTLEVKKIALRVPKYTEATWASSQRRKSGDLGVTMYDFVVLFEAI